MSFSGIVALNLKALENANEFAQRIVAINGKD